MSVWIILFSNILLVFKYHSRMMSGFSPVVSLWMVGWFEAL